MGGAMIPPMQQSVQPGICAGAPMRSFFASPSADEPGVMAQTPALLSQPPALMHAQQPSPMPPLGSVPAQVTVSSQPSLALPPQHISPPQLTSPTGPSSPHLAIAPSCSTPVKSAPGMRTVVASKAVPAAPPARARNPILAKCASPVVSARASPVVIATETAGIAPQPATAAQAAQRLVGAPSPALAGGTLATASPVPTPTHHPGA
jgi:hypothetical protein